MNKKLVPALDSSNAFFTSYSNNGKYISFYGDNHPYYAGSVVKAMSSARNGYPHVAAMFGDDIREAQDVIIDNNREAQSRKMALLDSFFASLDTNFTATVVSVEKLTPTIVEVVVRAPYAAKKFQPGEFYRLQNYEVGAETLNGQPMVMEGLAMTGAWTDTENGLLSMIGLEIGSSTRMMSRLKTGERVVVMGPTGAPTHIPHNETVMLCGGGLGNAVLFSISKALKANGCKVVYFAGYKNGDDVFKMDEIESGTDQVIWCSDTGGEIAPRRPQDKHYRGNIIQTMQEYHSGSLGEKSIRFEDVDRIIAIGSDGMMRAVKDSRHTIFQPFLKQHIAIGSINSPMQCMMKEICAQCLQKHVDPETGKEIT
ncbi:MAG: pyridine nucleotide-disulfide oxidoreductase, partial [Candidatus Kapabacteria bacterium]|nr:pyridine nucleotide-disulfide oxidoreductase [Candidatus Kapabacteria bacterium]